MLNHYPEYITEAVPTDVVVETALGTYVGWFDRSRLDRSAKAAEIEKQPIWKIKFIETTQNASGDNTMRTLYPEGSKEYEHRWNDRETLQYKYAN